MEFLADLPNHEYILIMTVAFRLENLHHLEFKIEYLTISDIQ